MLGYQTKTAPKILTDVVKYEVDPIISRERGTLAQNETILLGTILGRVAVAANLIVAAAALAGNTGGSGALTLADPAVSSAVKPGNYRAICFETASNAGKFMVFDPDGVPVGVATVGVAFTGVVKFTIADATDFVTGDGFVISVTPGVAGYQYVPWDPDATDGSQFVAGVSLSEAISPADAALDGELTVLRRLSKVRIPGLEYPDGATDAEKASAHAQLYALGIIPEYAM